MPKKKERNPEEFYKGKLREAQKQIRDLQRQIRILEKTGHIKKQRVESIKEDKPLMCPECGKGELKILDIVGRTFHICHCCGYRKKVNG
jgi:hypothetical protein